MLFIYLCSVSGFLTSDILVNSDSADYSILVDDQITDTVTEQQPVMLMITAINATFMSYGMDETGNISYVQLVRVYVTLCINNIRLYSLNLGVIVWINMLLLT